MIDRILDYVEAGLASAGDHVSAWGGALVGNPETGYITWGEGSRNNRYTAHHIRADGELKVFERHVFLRFMKPEQAERARRLYAAALPRAVEATRSRSAREIVERIDSPLDTARRIG